MLLRWQDWPWQDWLRALRRPPALALAGVAVVAALMIASLPR